MITDGFSIGFRYPQSIGMIRVLEQLSEILPGAELHSAALYVYPKESDPASGEDTELLSIENLPLKTGKRIWKTLRVHYSFLSLLSGYEPVIMGGRIERYSDAKLIGTVDGNGRIVSEEGRSICCFCGKQLHGMADTIDGIVFAFPSAEQSARARCCRTASELQNAGEGVLFRLVPLCDCDSAVQTFTSALQGRFAFPAGEKNPIGLLPDRSAVMNASRVSEEREIRAYTEYAFRQGCRTLYAAANDPSGIPFMDMGIDTRILSDNAGGADTLNDVLCEKQYAFRDRIKRWYCRSTAEDEVRFRALWNTSARTVRMPEAVAVK